MRKFLHKSGLFEIENNHTLRQLVATQPLELGHVEVISFISIKLFAFLRDA